MNRLHINRRASSGKKGLSAGVVWAVVVVVDIALLPQFSARSAGLQSLDASPAVCYFVHPAWARPLRVTGTKPSAELLSARASRGNISVCSAARTQPNQAVLVSERSLARGASRLVAHVASNAMPAKIR